MAPMHGLHDDRGVTDKTAKVRGGACTAQCRAVHVVVRTWVVARVIVVGRGAGRVSDVAGHELRPPM